MNDYYKISTSNLADILGVSKSTVQKWIISGKLKFFSDKEENSYFLTEELLTFPALQEMIESQWDRELKTKPLVVYNSIELFAGAGGLALGLHKSGFNHVMLNEIDKDACHTLKYNHPEWNVVNDDIHNLDFSCYKNKIDLLSGGFPCQTFSYAGKKAGFNDARGTLFYEMARAIDEIKPKIILCENVKGLLSHDKGKTLEVILNILNGIGYIVLKPKILHAVRYKVPQKRERLIIIAIRKDLFNKATFKWPDPYKRIMTLRDAFFKGELYDCDVPTSEGESYSEKKKKVLDLVPQGGNWKDLPENIKKEFMGGSYFLGGGKTGIARRLSFDEPSLTLTCSPAMKQTERCHPIESRPLTIREYARIQTFPDNWIFSGNLASQYKQIGNAVPVNLAYAIGRSLIRFLNALEERKNK